MNLHQEYAKAVTRRHFFRDCGVGLGAIALADLLARDRARAALTRSDASAALPTP